MGSDTKTGVPSNDLALPSRRALIESRSDRTGSQTERKTEILESGHSAHTSELLVEENLTESNSCFCDEESNAAASEDFHGVNIVEKPIPKSKMGHRMELRGILGTMLRETRKQSCELDSLALRMHESMKVLVS